MLLPDVIQRPAEIINDTVDLVAVCILPFCIWVWKEITEIKNKQRDHQHLLTGVDGKNGIRSTLKIAHERIDRTQKYDRIIIRLLRILIKNKPQDAVR